LSNHEQSPSCDIEDNKQRADLLYKADEADKGVLVTADWMTAARYMREPEKTE
jgi:hypothetical protein